MSQNEYIRYKQRHIDDIKATGRRRGLICVSIVFILLSIITFLGTDGFQNWPCIYERLSLALSALALLVALSAFMWQKISIDIQVHESKQNVSALIESNQKSQALIAELSAKGEREQIQYRSRAFESLKLSLVIIEKDRNYYGNELFKYLFLEYPYSYNHTTFKGLFSFLQGPGDGSYIESEALPILSPYFGLFFELIRYIDACIFISVEEKKDQIDVLKLSLTEFEVVLLYYHGLMPGREIIPLRKLIEKYNLLENINFDYLIADNNHNNYEESAFGSKGKQYTQQREKEMANWPCNQNKTI